MNFNIALVSILSIGSTVAQAASVNSASYDPQAKVITVEVSYGGGCKEHKFKLKVNGCAESFPVQCKIDLIDTTAGDFCEALISKTVTFKAGDYGLLDSYYDNASITIKGSDNSSASFQLTRAGGQNPTSEATTYSCPAGNGRFVIFKPEFGEVHFVNNDGSEWKQHDDGLTFEQLQLESFPVQFSTTITDDEGNKVGGWRYVDGARSFKAQYRAKSYSGCKQD